MKLLVCRLIADRGSNVHKIHIHTGSNWLGIAAVARRSKRMMSAEWQPTRSHRKSLKGLKRITPADVDHGRFSVAPENPELDVLVECSGETRTV
jgi:hypothetical protein